ncbi:Cytochrome oxidase assembly [Dispira parvispora]|uniref:Cytochrome c oxidase assembly protein COX16, mitochondrial n=1 Tax=Dispira parvispora TaxID=1520584 RepID=A0A9W8AI80_9FUNG|nr:Cytochrome oxidase assembly [Dispira parvispora]
MRTFQQRSWGKWQYSRYYQRTASHPFLYFGLPFISSIVLGSFALTPFARTRYELNEMHSAKPINEDEFKLKINKRPLSLQEEYWRLQEKDLDNWSNKRVERPPGEEE